MKLLKLYQKPKVETIAMVPPTPIAQSPEFSVETEEQPVDLPSDWDTPFDDLTPIADEGD